LYKNLLEFLRRLDVIKTEVEIWSYPPSLFAFRTVESLSPCEWRCYRRCFNVKGTLHLDSFHSKTTARPGFVSRRVQGSDAKTMVAPGSSGSRARSACRSVITLGSIRGYSSRSVRLTTHSQLLPCSQYPTTGPYLEPNLSSLRLSTQFPLRPI